MHEGCLKNSMRFHIWNGGEVRCRRLFGVDNGAWTSFLDRCEKGALAHEESVKKGGKQEETAEGSNKRRRLIQTAKSKKAKGGKKAGKKAEGSS